MRVRVSLSHAPQSDRATPVAPRLAANTPPVHHFDSHFVREAVALCATHGVRGEAMLQCLLRIRREDATGAVASAWLADVLRSGLSDARRTNNVAVRRLLVTHLAEISDRDADSAPAPGSTGETGTGADVSERAEEGLAASASAELATCEE